MTVYLYTFGCKVNHYETQSLKESMKKKGFSIDDDYTNADIAIVNSCTVTGQSNLKCRQLLHKIKRENPSSILVLTGCFPQAYKEEVKDFDFCDIICGSSNKMEIPSLINDYLENKQQIIKINEHTKTEKIESTFVNHYENNTRANLKIQDGCDQYCSYCIIPFARGHIRSKPLDEIKSEVLALALSGHKEIVLVGINLCCYGKDLGDDIRLVDAIEAACSIDGIERVRLSSIEPEMILDDDIERMSKQDKLCPHFHLSLQSGCDKTLKEMNRKYNSSEYRELCKKLRNAFEDCSITTDVMVGFPGETDEDFNKSLEFVKSIGFSKVHIFPYSIREGTIAGKRSDQINGKVKKKRAKLMAQATDEKSLKFLNNQIGKVLPILFERESEQKYYQGHSPNYTFVKILRENDKKSLRNQILCVKIIKAEKNHCIGEFVEK